MNPVKVTVARGDNSPVRPPAVHFHYVDQGNYLTVPLESEPCVVYSDSATSCIITIVVCASANGNSVTLAHLDSPECINAFFERLAEFGTANYQVFAQGANPPDNETAKQNAAALKERIAALGASVTRADLYLLEGDPRQENRGDFGLVYAPVGAATVTNQPYTLELYERDPTCGGQTVYCIMRRQETPPLQIRDAGKPFTHAELVELAEIAIRFRKDPRDPSTAFTNIVNLQSEAIRQNWSTTPAYEAPWFSDQLKLGAAFSVAMAPVVSLSAGHLLNASEPSFDRLRAALLEKV